MSAMNQLAIESRKLTRRYDAVVAVDALDMQIEYGTIFGLLGANGAGKSTTIKMLTTLLRPTSGTANVAGFDIVSPPRMSGGASATCRSCCRPTARSPAMRTSLLSAKLYGMPARRERARIDEALAFMGLTEFGEQARARPTRAA